MTGTAGTNVSLVYRLCFSKVPHQTRLSEVDKERASGVGAVVPTMSTSHLHQHLALRPLAYRDQTSCLLKISLLADQAGQWRRNLTKTTYLTEEAGEALLEMFLGRQNVDLGDTEADHQVWIDLLERLCDLERKI